MGPSPVPTQERHGAAPPTPTRKACAQQALGALGACLLYLSMGMYVCGLVPGSLAARAARRGVVVQESHVLCVHGFQPCTRVWLGAWQTASVHIGSTDTRTPHRSRPAVELTLACRASQPSRRTGPLLVKTNNMIFNSVGFKFPMAVSSLGLISTSLFSHMLVWSKVVALEHTSTVTPRFYLTRVLPVGVTMALTLALGNTAYL